MNNIGIIAEPRSLSVPIPPASLVHDLNNALMIAAGYCELLMQPDTSEDRRYKSAAKAHAAVFRAAEIAKSMHANPTARQPIESVEVDDFIAKLVSAPGYRGSCRIAFHAGSHGSVVDTSRGELRQVLETAIAAVRGTTDNCKLSIHTGLLHCDAVHSGSRLQLAPGNYVWISIALDGIDSRRPGSKAQACNSAPKPNELQTCSASAAVREDGTELAISEYKEGGAVAIYLPCSAKNL
jgi:hypothetical protein